MSQELSKSAEKLLSERIGKKELVRMNIADIGGVVDKATGGGNRGKAGTQIGVMESFRGLVNSFLRAGEADGSGGGGASVSKFTVNLAMFYINHTILLIVFFLISIYKNLEFSYRRLALKLLSLAYYPNKTPQLIRDDVNKLTKIPRRVSCILDLKDEDDENGGIDGHIDDISELAAWALLAGIPALSIYEYNGAVQDHLPQLCRYINKTLSVYFGTDSLPVYSIKVPHSNTLIYSTGANRSAPTLSASAEAAKYPESVDLEISLLSRVDGKPTIIELTKTMSELANRELKIDDITIDLIDEELVELVGPEPDLLISFGPSLDLQDYPPWHIRLSEIYWEPDNRDVNYAVFIRALQKYANCRVNVGK